MNSQIMSTMETTPFQSSPTESLMSAPGDSMISLFPSDCGAGASVNPVEMMTPQSFSDDKSARYSAGPEDYDLEDEDDEEDGTPAPGSDNKTKKRKSWGQVLPEPKTNLPPRKRAKTEDEKEQRRVERVLRNRRAAQSSRERKRLEVEALEKRNHELESLLLNAQKANLMLVEELNRFRRDSGVVTRTSSPLANLEDNPVTLSQQLFAGPQDGRSTSEQPSKPALADITSHPSTVNPASLTPELAPVPDSANAIASDLTRASSPDLTQHPAAMLSDLQCHTSAEAPRSFKASRNSTTTTTSSQLRAVLASASAILSACQRPLTQIAMSSKAGFSLLPSPQLLTTIIWLVTLPPASRTTSPSTSTSTTSSSTTRPRPSTAPASPITLWQRATASPQTTAGSSTSPSSTLRFKSLRKILTSSPNLARPLLDATMVALRLASSEGRAPRTSETAERDGSLRATPCDTDLDLTQCLSAIALPSTEVLLTLCWAVRLELRRIEAREDGRRGLAGAALGRELSALRKKPTMIHQLQA